MKVHLQQIPAEGLHLEGEEDCLISDLESEGVRCVGPMEYKLDIGVAEGSLWANGSLKQPVELSCVNCLKRFTYNIQVPAFALHTELHGPETVDLAPFMREDILLNLPAHPRCDAQGAGECKGAVKQGAATAEDDRKSRAAKRKHDWGELDKLKIRKSG